LTFKNLKNYSETAQVDEKTLAGSLLKLPASNLKAPLPALIRIHTGKFGAKYERQSKRVVHSSFELDAQWMRP
jgi:hypothetical protein